MAFLPVEAALVATTTATVSNVTSSITPVTLFSLNVGRRGATIFNDSTQTLYVKFGSGVSSSSFTVLLVAQAYYELPNPVYLGMITGVWASANGFARITEIA